MDSPTLKPILKELSAYLGVDIDVLYALISIESTGKFSIGGGKIPILLERHKVYKYYKQAHGSAAARAMVKAHPDICNPNAGGYGRYRDQYKRLAKAIKYCGAEVAHKATSFGAFQLMGFNYKPCGFNSAVEMSDALHGTTASRNAQAEQIMAFLSFCAHYKKGELLRAMRERNFHRIAYLYNGSNYRINKYAQRLITAAGEYRRRDQRYKMSDMA